MLHIWYCTSTTPVRREACCHHASVLALGQPVVVVVVALLGAIRLHGVPATFHRDETDALEDFHVASDLKSKTMKRQRSNEKRNYSFCAR